MATILNIQIIQYFIISEHGMFHSCLVYWKNCFWVPGPGLICPAISIAASAPKTQ